MRKAIALAAWLAVLVPATAHADSVQYAYDTRGRLSQVTYASGTVITYTYDDANNLVVTTVSCNGAC